MKALAMATGVTTSLISQIEHDKANPSINTLLSLSNALNTDIRNFFQDYVPNESASLVHPRDRIRIGSEERGWIQEYLTASDLTRFSVAYNSIAPGTSTSKIPEINHPHQKGYEFGYVLKGCLQVKVEQNTYLLEEGDAITFEAQKKHVLTNAHNGTTEVIWIVIPGIDE